MNLERAIRSLGELDSLATGESWIHLLDPRAKTVTTLLFVFTVVSVDPYRIAQLLPFVLFPVATAARAEIPPNAILARLLIPLPFILMVGILNPLLDRAPVAVIGPLVVTGGVVTLLSLVIKGLLTVSAAILLAATTGMADIARGLGGLKVPRPLVIQLLFVHRYLSLLADEALRSVRARNLRSFGGRGEGISSVAPLLGTLLIRTFERSERIHRAMLSRGFDGEIRTLSARRLTGWDLLYTCGWGAAFLTFRLVDIPLLIGRGVMGVMG